MCLYCRPQPPNSCREMTFIFPMCARTHIKCASWYRLFILSYHRIESDNASANNSSLCPPKWNSGGVGEQQGGAAQGTDAIQRHPFVTANCCAVGSGSQGGRFAVDVNPVYESCPGSCGSWVLKLFPSGWSFVLAVLPGGAGPIDITWPCVDSVWIGVNSSRSRWMCDIARTGALIHILTRAAVFSLRISPLPFLEFKAQAPLEKHTKRRRIGPSESRTKKIPRQGSVAGLKVKIKALRTRGSDDGKSKKWWASTGESVAFSIWAPGIVFWFFFYFSGLWKCPPSPRASSCSKQLKMKNNRRAGKRESCCDSVAFRNNGVPLAWALFRSFI